MKVCTLGATNTTCTRAPPSPGCPTVVTIDSRASPITPVFSPPAFAPPVGRRIQRRPCFRSMAASWLDSDSKFETDSVSSAASVVASSHPAYEQYHPSSSANVLRLSIRILVHPSRHYSFSSFLTLPLPPPAMCSPLCVLLIRVLYFSSKFLMIHSGVTDLGRSSGRARARSQTSWASTP